MIFFLKLGFLLFMSMALTIRELDGQRMPMSSPLRHFPPQILEDYEVTQ